MVGTPLLIGASRRFFTLFFLLFFQMFSIVLHTFKNRFRFYSQFMISFPAKGFTVCALIIKANLNSHSKTFPINGFIEFFHLLRLALSQKAILQYESQYIFIYMPSRMAHDIIKKQTFSFPFKKKAVPVFLSQLF